MFIQGTQTECRRILKTILQNPRLCNLLSPFFTPNASPAELVLLYEEVVNALHADSGDVIFMLLTKVWTRTRRTWDSGSGIML